MWECTRLADPSHTAQIRERFRRDVAGRFRDVRGSVRSWTGYDQDVFGLKSEQSRTRTRTRTETRAARPQDVYRFDTDRGKIRAFLSWLREKFRADILDPVDLRGVRRGEHWTASYVRAAYGRAWENARGRLRNEGIDVGERVDVVFDLPVPKRQLRKLYTRTYRNLESVSSKAAPTVRGELTRGLAEGWHPRKMARRLTTELRDLQRNRAETLARTEVINSYTEATLDRYERAGIDAVQHGEWETADDDRVCPICSALDGRDIAIGEARTGTFQFEPDSDQPDHLAGTYPLRPPAHPNCRCTLLPVIA